MKELTKAEEQLMKSLWKLGKGYLKDIVGAYPPPQPAYTTVSTVVNVLVKKGFIGFEAHGKSREYFAKVSRSKYMGHKFQNMLHNFFNDSPSQFASFFTKESDLDIQELEEMKSMIEAEIAKQKQES